jgi:hypothetical protein
MQRLPLALVQSRASSRTSAETHEPATARLSRDRRDETRRPKAIVQIHPFPHSGYRAVAGPLLFVRVPVPAQRGHDRAKRVLRALNSHAGTFAISIQSGLGAILPFTVLQRLRRSRRLPGRVRVAYAVKHRIQRGNLRTGGNRRSLAATRFLRIPIRTIFDTEGRLFWSSVGPTTC